MHDRTLALHGCGCQVFAVSLAEVGDVGLLAVQH